MGGGHADGVSGSSGDCPKGLTGLSSPAGRSVFGYTLAPRSGKGFGTLTGFLSFGHRKALGFPKQGATRAPPKQTRPGAPPHGARSGLLLGGGPGNRPRMETPHPGLKEQKPGARVRPGPELGPPLPTGASVPLSPVPPRALGAGQVCVGAVRGRFLSTPAPRTPTET